MSTARPPQHARRSEQQRLRWGALLRQPTISALNHRLGLEFTDVA